MFGLSRVRAFKCWGSQVSLLVHADGGILRVDVESNSALHMFKTLCLFTFEILGRH